MTVGDEDEALRWQGDAEPQPVDKPEKPIPAAKPVQAETALAAEEPGTTEKPATSSILLISYGILAGAYLIYTIGWLAAPAVPRSATLGILGDVAYFVNVGLAIASPAIWFGTAFLLTRGRKPIVRLLALLLGLVVVLPWPFVILGAS